MQSAKPISTRAMVGYGLASAPAIYAYMLILIMYMKYAVDDLGASPAAVGAIFFLAKMWDAVSDPMVGSLSDRTERPSGRRRPWILAGAPLLGLFGIMAWSPPAMLEGWSLNLWIAISVIGFYTAYTIFDVPHMSLGAELSLDARERNRIFGVRQTMRMLGMFAAGTLGTFVVAKGVGAATTMAWGLALVTLVLVMTGVSTLPPERADFRGRGGQNPVQAVRDVARNPHARLFLVVIFIDAIGAGGIGVLIPFVLEYVVGEPHLVPYLLGASMLSGLVTIPLWVRLARRFEKRRLILFSMGLSAVGYGSVVLVGEGDWEIIAAASVLSGAANACSNTLGYTLKSEIIDCDEHATGERKEGAYFAGWSFVNKLGGGIMVGAVGVALSWSGFVRNEPVQTELVEYTMLGLMGGLPLVCYSIGAVLFSRFALSETAHARIRLELDERARGRVTQAGAPTA